MKRVSLILGMVIFTVAVLAGCGGQSQTANDGRQIKVDDSFYRAITPAQLKTMLENKDFLLVNVHIPYDGELPRTDFFVPYNQIEQRISSFPENRSAKVVVYCRSGPMSAIAARTLVSLGFTNVWDMEGGMGAWQAQGYELINKPR